MAEAKFKAGDVVTIQSDSIIRMTVESLMERSVQGEKLPPLYKCIWWDAREIKSYAFSEESLKKA